MSALGRFVGINEIFFVIHQSKCNLIPTPLPGLGGGAGEDTAINVDKGSASVVDSADRRTPARSPEPYATKLVGSRSTGTERPFSKWIASERGEFDAETGDRWPWTGSE